MATRTAYAWVFSGYTIPNTPIITLDDSPGFAPLPGSSTGGLWISGSSGLSLDGRPGRRFTVTTEDDGGGTLQQRGFMVWYDSGSPGPQNQEVGHNFVRTPGTWRMTMGPTGRFFIEVGPNVTSLQIVGDPEPGSAPGAPPQQIGVAALGYAEGGFDWVVQAGGSTAEGDFAGTGVRYLARAHLKYTGQSDGLDHWQGELAVNGVTVATTSGGFPVGTGMATIKSVLLRPFNGLHTTELDYFWLRIGTTPGGEEILYRNWEQNDEFYGGWTDLAVSGDAFIGLIFEELPPLAELYPNEIGEDACEDFLPIRERYGDPQNQLCVYLRGLGYMLKEVDDISKDGPNGEPGWSQIFDLTRAKTKWLPWMGQLVGYKVPPKPDDQPIEEYDAQQRERMITRSAYRRGTAALLGEIAAEHLGGSKRVIVFERYGGNPWVIKVFVFAAEIITSMEEITRAVLDQKVAGLLMEFTALEPSAGYDIVRASSLTYQDVKDNHPDYNDVLLHPDRSTPP